ncbi:MAG: HDOD domain-containing protein [Gammaproteobacteria bacterium]|nr:HDOD domain-containing protein [Gammaproteobacteria bacterium]
MFGSGTPTQLSPAATPRAADLGRLAPYAGFAGATLAAIADQSTVEALASGKVPARWFDDAAVFLQSGQIELRTANRGRVFLSSVSPPARFPLPAPDAVRISAVGATTFIRVPHAALPAGPAADGGPTADGAAPHLSSLRRLLDAKLASGEIALPSMPDLAVKLNSALRTPDNGNDDHDVAKLIQLDPALATKVIHVVNSAAFRFNRKASTVQQAVTRLGRDRVRNLAVAFLLRHAFHTDSAALQRRAQALWLRSCQIAAISFTLARQLSTLDPERAMLAGLIHLIGRLPVLGLANRHPELFGSRSLLDAAMQAFDKPLGRLVLERWSFDADMLDAVAHAGDWTRVGAALPDYADVVVLAQLHADIGRPGAARRPSLPDVPAFQKLELGKLTPNKSLQALEDADHEILELRRILSRSG